MFVHADDPPISLNNYWEQVERTYDVVVNLEQTPNQETRQAQLAALATEWETITQVRLPNGDLTPVDHSFLVAELRRTPPDLPQLKYLLSSLLAVQATWPQNVHSAVEIKVLEDILAQSQFQWLPEQPSFLAELSRKILLYIWEWLSPLLPEEIVINLADSPFGSIFGYLITGFATVLLVAVIIYMVYGFLAEMVSETGLNSETDQEKALTSDVAFKRAQEFSISKDYRTAVRYLYLSSLLILDERELLRYDRTKTNREYLQSVAQSPNLGSLLREVIDVFDRVWYGHQPVDQEAYTQYVNYVAELRRQK